MKSKGPCAEVKNQARIFINFGESEINICLFLLQVNRPKSIQQNNAIFDRIFHQACRFARFCFLMKVLQMEPNRIDRDMMAFGNFPHCFFVAQINQNFCFLFAQG